MAHIADTPLVSRQIHLHSSHADVRKDNKSSDCLWYLHNPIRVPPNIEILIGIENVQIPHSIYTFSAVRGNNRFKIEYANDDTNNIMNHVSVTLPDGHYTLFEVSRELEKAEHALGVQNFFIIKEDKRSHKLRIRRNHRVASKHTEYIKIIESPKELGFTVGQKVEDIDVQKDDGTYNELIATNCYDLNGLSSILLGSNFATANIDSAHTGVNNSILARIPITAAPGGTIFYERKSDFQIVLKEDQFSQIHLRLMDDNRKSIELNGLDWHITLNFNFRYSPGMQRPANLQDIHNTNTVYRLKNLNEDTIDTAADPLLGNFFKMTDEELEQQSEGIKNIDK